MAGPCSSKKDDDPTVDDTPANPSHARPAVSDMAMLDLHH